MSRKVVLHHLSGSVRELELSIVTITSDGSMVVRPFVRETAGVVYVDTPLHCSEFSEGKWKFD